MSVLDELREALRRRTLPMNSKRLQREIAHAIDAFEAAHPGLEDHTIPCHVCKKPTIEAGALAEGRMGRWIWQVCCSNACAKEAK